MTVTLNLPPHVEQAILAEAQAKGMSPDELVQDLLLARLPPAVAAHEIASRRVIRQIKAWVASHEGDNLPVLSDEAMSRESIYRERGL